MDNIERLNYRLLKQGDPKIIAAWSNNVEIKTHLSFLEIAPLGIHYPVQLATSKLFRVDCNSELHVTSPWNFSNTIKAVRLSC